MYFDRAALEAEKGACGHAGEWEKEVLRDLRMDDTSWQLSSKVVVKLQGVSHNSGVCLSRIGWARTGSRKNVPQCNHKGLGSLAGIQGDNARLRISCEGCICTTKARLFLCVCDWY